MSSATWWKQLDDEVVCPITLEQINALTHEPISLHSVPYEPSALAQYAKQALEDPTTRRRLSQHDCHSIDLHLRRLHFPPQHVEASYIRAMHHSDGLDSGPVALSRSADLLASFRPPPRASSRRLQQQSQPQQRQRLRSHHRVVDDDAGLSLGPSSDSAHHSSTEAFPALGAPAGSTPQPSRPPARLRRPHQQHSQQQQQGQVEQSSEQTARAHISEQRKKQLAAAFGVPEDKPSMFAKSSQDTFPEDVIKDAAEDLPNVESLEQQLEHVVMSYHTSSRLSSSAVQRVALQPTSSTRWRRLQHTLAEAFSTASCSYGSGANRAVHVFVHPCSGIPPNRLSDAAREYQHSSAACCSDDDSCDEPTLGADDQAEDERRDRRVEGEDGDVAQASALAAQSDAYCDPQSAEDAARGEKAREYKVLVKLEGENPSVDSVMKHLWDFEESGELTVHQMRGNRHRAVLCFTCEQARSSALERVGGGVRGAFTIRQSVAHAASSSSLAEKSSEENKTRRESKKQQRHQQQQQGSNKKESQAKPHQNAFDMLLSAGDADDGVA